MTLGLRAPVARGAGGEPRGVSYIAQVHVYWVAIWVLPLLFGAVAWRVCTELQASERVVAARRDAEARSRLARRSL